MNNTNFLAVHTKMVVDTKDFRQHGAASPPVKHRLEQWFKPLITQADIDMKLEQAEKRKLQLVKPENRKVFLSVTKRTPRKIKASKENAAYVKEYVFNRVLDYDVCRRVKERLGSWSRPQMTQQDIDLKLANAEKRKLQL